eukprot:16444051-Heterocapsa_arctica.AAC.1
MAKINFIRNHYLQKPTDKFPGEEPVHVAVKSDEDPRLTYGHSPMLSPPEPAHAVIFQVFADITAGMADDELRVWRSLFLSVNMVYHKIDNMEVRYQTSLNLRESMSSMGDAVKRTALERGFEIMEANSLLEK